MTMQTEGIQPDPLPQPAVFVATLGEEARPTAIDVSFDLRAAGICTWMAFGQRGLRSQLREAHKRDVSYAVILGRDEIEAQQATVRDMTLGEQERVALQELTGWLSARISQM